MVKVVLVSGKDLLSRLGRIVPAILPALLLSACVAMRPAGPVVPLIASDAVAAVVVDSPFGLYRALDAFWYSAGMGAAVGSGLRGFVNKNVPGIDRAVLSLDFARPWALAVLPLSSGSAENRILVYIPYRDGASGFPDKLGSKAGLRLVKRAEGYAVYATGEGDVDFPPAKALDLESLARYPAASIKVWVDPRLIRGSAGNGWKPIEDAAGGLATGEPGGPAGDSVGPVNSLSRLGLALLSQLRAADAALVPDATGLTVRLGATPTEGSLAARLMSRAAASPSALDWADSVRADRLCGWTWSLDPEAAAGFARTFTPALLSTLGLNGDASERVAPLEARWAAAAGPHGAAAFDISVGPTALEGRSGQHDPRTIAEALRLDLEFVQELRDKTAYSRLLGGIGSDPDLRAVLDICRGATGLDITPSDRDMQKGSYSYGELRLKFAIADAGKFSEFVDSILTRAGERAALEALSGIVDLRWKAEDSRLSATTGDTAELRAMVARSRSVPTLAEDRDFVAFEKTIPPAAISVGYLSMRRLGELIRQLFPSWAVGSGESSPDTKRLRPLYDYLSAIPAAPPAAAATSASLPSIEAGCFIPASDIGFLIHLVDSLRGTKVDAQRQGTQE
ncbi:MAG: hypothetical protein ACLQMF_13585 [Rectinemataceae bacterium]